MKYELKRTSQFKKDFKAILKSGYDISKFEAILTILVNGDVVPEKYKDHPLRNTQEFKNCRELHIEPDWLLVYKYNNNNLILYLIRTGTHSNLF